MMNISLFSDTSALYFFSALLQANAAIIAIIGVFWIFKIQTYQAGVDSIKNALSIERGITSNLDVDPSIISKFESLDLSEKTSYMNQEILNDSLRSLLQSWVRNEESIDNLKSGIRIPVILLAVGIVFNAFGLVIANLIHQVGHIVELIVLLLVLLYEFLIVGVVVNTILSALGLRVLVKWLPPRTSPS